MSETISQEIVDQGRTAEPVAEATGGGGVGAIDEAAALQGDVQQPKGDGETLGQDNLHPELEEARKSLLKDYHAKTQKLAEDRRQLEAKSSAFQQDADYFRALSSQGWFKEALQAEKLRRSGGQSDYRIPDDVFEKVKEGDKGAFERAVADVAQQMLRANLGSLPSREEVEKLKEGREFDRLAGLYGDFKKLHDSGALDAYLKGGLDYESAYARAKLHHGSSEEQVRREAEKLIQRRKEGAVHTTGVTHVKGQRTVKLAKNAGFDQAFDEIYKAVSAGEDVKLERE